MNYRITISRLVLMALCFFHGFPDFAQEPPSATILSPTDLTVEWCFNGGARRVVELPWFAWLDNGRLLIHKKSAAGDSPRFILHNPANGEETEAFDPVRALSSLKKICPDSPGGLNPPDVLEPSGRYALYMFSGDLYLLHLPTSQFTRITRSPAPELSPKFSPDGTKIAWVREYNIWIHAIGQDGETALTGDGSKTLLNGDICDMYKEDIYSYDSLAFWWSPDSRAIAFLQSDISEIGEVLYSDNSDYFPRYTAQRYSFAGGPIARVRTGIIETAPSCPVAPTVWAQLPDQESDYYITRVQWLPDGSRLALQVMNRAQTAVSLYFTQRRNGLSRRILTEKDPAWVNIDDDLHFTRNGAQFIFGSERTGYKHLYLYDASGALRHPITQGEWAVRGPFQTAFWNGQSVVCFNETKNMVYFTGQEKSARERHLYRINLNGKGLKRLSKETGFHSPVFSKDGRYYMEIYSNHREPPRLTLHRADGQPVRELAAANTAAIKQLDIALPTQFAIPAPDGFPLTARILKPRNFQTGKKYPVIIHHYGGPSAPMTLDRWNSSVFFYQLLRRRGYIVFSVDIRSAQAIGKKYENSILGHMLGAPELEDLLTAVKWLKNQEYVDGDRLGIWGWSYGGCFTLNAMLRTREFKAGVAGAAVSDLRFQSAKFTEFAMKLPQNNREAYDAVSMIKDAPNLHGRLLLVHGADDDNVRLQNALRMTEALVNAGKQFEMMIYPQQKHGFDPTAQIHFHHKMLEFWEKSL